MLNRNTNPLKSANGAGSTEIPPGPVPAQSDHSPRCGNAVCSPGTAPSFAQRHAPEGTESAPVHRRPDDKDGRKSGEGRAVRESELRSNSECRMNAGKMLFSQVMEGRSNREPAVSFYSALDTVTGTSVSAGWNAAEDSRRAQPAISRVGAGMSAALPRAASVV